MQRCRGWGGWGQETSLLSRSGILGYPWGVDRDSDFCPLEKVCKTCWVGVVGTLYGKGWVVSFKNLVKMCLGRELES
jgi:hypothetical protein